MIIIKVRYNPSFYVIGLSLLLCAWLISLILTCLSIMCVCCCRAKFCSASFVSNLLVCGVCGCGWGDRDCTPVLVLVSSEISLPKCIISTDCTPVLGYENSFNDTSFVCVSVITSFVCLSESRAEWPVLWFNTCALRLNGLVSSVMVGVDLLFPCLHSLKVSWLWLCCAWLVPFFCCIILMTDPFSSNPMTQSEHSLFFSRYARHKHQTLERVQFAHTIPSAHQHWDT